MRRRRRREICEVVEVMIEGKECGVCSFRYGSRAWGSPLRHPLSDGDRTKQEGPRTRRPRPITWRYKATQHTRNA